MTSPQASSILQLNDSHNSIEQSRTIEKLTYLTIIYLPVSLVTVSPAPLPYLMPWFDSQFDQAIFAIPDNQQVVYSNMGLAWYIGALFLLVAATGTVAVFPSYLKRALKQIGVRLLGCLRFPLPFRPPPGGGAGAKSDTTSNSRSDGNNGSAAGEVSASPSHHSTIRETTTGWGSWAARILKRRRRTSSIAGGSQSLELVYVYGGGKEDV